MIYYKSDLEQTAISVATLLNECKVGVLPCDTIYGLSAIYGAGNEALKKLKGRDGAKPFLALATLEQVSSLTESVPDEIRELWPAPLTVILNLKTGGTQAFRVPDDAFLQRLLCLAGCPVYSTSVNISGKPALLTFSDIEREFSDKADFLVKGEDKQGNMPSTLLDCTVRPFRILRQGNFQIPAEILG